MQYAAMRAELGVRYTDWTALLARLLGTDDDNPDVTMMVALIDVLGTRIALDPDGIPDAERRPSAIIEATIADLSTSTTSPPAGDRVSPP